MTQTRRIGALNARGEGCLITGPVPPVTRGTLLVKVHASAISPGTELAPARRTREGRGATRADAPPRPFGYQNAGEVVAVGDGVIGFAPGDRVACMGAGYALHSDYVVVPQNLCAVLPEGLGYEEAAFCHLAMTSLHAVRRAAPEIGEYLVVVGLGLVGQLAARLGQLAGAYVMGWDRIAFRCEIARRWGIDGTAVVGADDLAEAGRRFTRGEGFDLGVLAFGGEGSAALRAVVGGMKHAPDGHAMGRVCVVGGMHLAADWPVTLGNLDLRACSRTGLGYHDEAWERGDSTYPPVLLRWTTQSNLRLVLRLMAEGRLDVRTLITHRVPLAEIARAVRAHLEHPDATLGTVLLLESDV